MASRSHLRSALLGGFVLLAGATPAIAAGAQAPAGGIGGYSAEPVGGPEGAPPYFQQQGAPGTRTAHEALVKNFSDKPVRLRVSAVDGETGTTSGSVYASGHGARRETGRWLRVGVREVRLAPRTQQRVAFEVVVPAKARAGDHLAGLAFEDAARRRSGGRFSVTQVVRVVVGVHVRVPGTAGAGLAVRGLRATALPGTRVPSVVVDLANTGRLMCRPRLAVKLTGKVSGRVTRALDTFLPGDRIAYPVAWPRPLAAGRYTAAVRSTGCGKASSRRVPIRVAHELSGTVRRPGIGVSSTRTPVPAAAASGGTPSWVVALVGILGVAAGSLVARRRRA